MQLVWAMDRSMMLAYHPDVNGMISHLRRNWQRATTRRHAVRFARAARHLHGPKPDNVPPDAIVVLVPRWRVGDLEAFHAHYRALGASHFVFFASGTPAAALAQIKALPGSIIVENGLRVSVPEPRVLAYLADTYGANRWCLMVHSDELLAFASDGTLELRGLTGYLEARGATALRAHRLAMFPKGALGSLTSLNLQQKIAECVYFDLSSLHLSADQAGTPSGSRKSYLDADGVPASCTPLIYNGPDATVAFECGTPCAGRFGDVTAVLKSYAQATELGYDAPDASLFSLTARRWNRAELLVRAGFIESSAAYEAWAREVRE